MRILCIGDIVGGGGIKLLQRDLIKLRQSLAIDFCVVNGENAASGLGMTGSIAGSLYKAGVDAITLGNHTWSKWELTSWIDSDPRMIRPLNGGPNWAGKGYQTFKVGAVTIVVMQILGLVNIQSYMSAFVTIDQALKEVKREIKPDIILVDFHAETTAEKKAMGYYLNGRVSAIWGTHTHVQTADEIILDRGTAYITDLGMSGPVNGVLGMSVDVALRRFVDFLPARYELADGPSEVQGAIIEIDSQTGRSLHIERFRHS